MRKHLHGGCFSGRESILDFSINLNPLGTPKAVREAAIRSMDSIEFYPDPEYPALTAALCSAENIAEESLILGNGSAELIDLFVRTIQPKTAVIPVPSFYEYERSLTAEGCEIRFVPYDQDIAFLPDERILCAITDKTDLVIICHPNNPTGRLFPKSLQERIVQRCKKTDTWLMVDECFLNLASGSRDSIENAEDTGSFRNYFQSFSKLLILKAFTKTYAIPGLRLGYAFSPDLDLIRKMKERIQPWNISVPAEAAGIAALQEKDYLLDSCDLIRKERKVLFDGLNRLGMEVYPGSANFILFRYPLESELEEKPSSLQQTEQLPTLYEQLLKKQILIRDCSNFRSLEKGFYRIAVRKPEENQLLLDAVAEMTGS